MPQPMRHQGRGCLPWVRHGSGCLPSTDGSPRAARAEGLAKAVDQVIAHPFPHDHWPTTCARTGTITRACSTMHSCGSPSSGCTCFTVGLHLLHCWTALALLLDCTAGMHGRAWRRWVVAGAAVVQCFCCCRCSGSRSAFGDKHDLV
jgi:hypothetical protein